MGQGRVLRPSWKSKNIFEQFLFVYHLKNLRTGLEFKGEIMEIKNVLLIILPVVVGVISSYLTYYFTIKTKKNEAILKFKEEKYVTLLITMQGFIGKTANADLKQSFFEEQYKSWLYCSDEVVKAINNMVRLVIDSRGKKPNTDEGRKAIGNIVLSMRKDLLGKTKLDYNDFQYTDIIE